MVRTLCKTNLVHTVSSYFLKIHCNTSLPSVSCSCKWSALRLFRPKFSTYFSYFPCILQSEPISSHTPQFYSRNNIKQKTKKPIRLLLKKWIVVIQSRNSASFIEPEVSLPYIEEPDIGSRPMPHECSYTSRTVTLRSLLILSAHLRLGFSFKIF
jgi:hypothetical protein